MRRAQARQPLRPAIRLAPDRLSYSFDPDLAGEALFHDCPPEVRAAALARMGAEPVGPQEERIRLSARYHALPKHYIRCLEDRAIPPETQEAMTADWPAGSVSTLPAGHSPFLSCPELWQNVSSRWRQIRFPAARPPARVRPPFPADASCNSPGSPLPSS